MSTNTIHPSQNYLTHISADHEGTTLNTFQHNDHHQLDNENDIDPVNNFFHNTDIDCRYYTEEQFNKDINSQDKISIIHFNSRSMYANFQSIKYYLSHFSHPFNIIAISETWFNNDKGTDFEMDGYEMTYKNRENKIGGGVALYVDKNLNYKVVEKLTTVVDNVLECVTIEILMEKTKNIRVSCIYRTPSSNIEIFKDWIEENFTNANHKITYICGDINIDLLNPNKHKNTEEFINTLYSLCLSQNHQTHPNYCSRRNTN